MTDLTGRAVLVVEDLFYLAMDVRKALRNAGAEVIGPFSTSAQALKSLTSRQPDCAVLDVNLSGESSFDVARTLRSMKVPFFFFTGYDAKGIPDEFAEVGRLHKPVEPPRLLDAVTNCLAGTNPAP